VSASGGSIEANGAELYYEAQGEGPPLVLIHGGLGSSKTWQMLVPHLVDSFRVITPDTRGHGRSTNPAGKLSYALLADDVAALIAALGLVHPIVGGWSDGGQIALEFGARHPGIAAGLVVGAAYPEFRDSGLLEANRQLLGADEAGRPDIAALEANLRGFTSLLKSCHPGGEPQWQEVVRQTAPMWLDYAGLTADELHRIAIPVLVLAADRDSLVPLDLMVALYRMLDNAELAVCPHATHGGPLTASRAEVFADMIRDFARRRTPSR